MDEKIILIPEPIKALEAPPAVVVTERIVFNKQPETSAGKEKKSNDL